MADDVLAKVASDLTTVNKEITNASSLIQVLKEAGEDTVKPESDLRQLIIKRDKWQRTLEDRGYTF
jgi:hypothetical protein